MNISTFATLASICNLGIKLLDTFRAHAMTKPDIHMLHHVRFYFIPVTFVIAYFFTGSADRNQASQGLYLVKLRGQLPIMFPHVFLRPGKCLLRMTDIHRSPPALIWPHIFQRLTFRSKGRVARSLSRFHWASVASLSLIPLHSNSLWAGNTMIE